MKKIDEFGPDAVCWCGKTRKEHSKDFCFAADKDKFVPQGLFDCTGCGDVFEKDQLEYVACEGLFCRICMNRIIDNMQGDNS